MFKTTGYERASSYGSLKLIEIADDSMDLELWIEEDLLLDYPHIMECVELAEELDYGGTIGGLAHEWSYCPFCGACL